MPPKSEFPSELAREYLHIPILVVEDDPDNLELLCALLSDQGYMDLYMASSAEEAIEQLNEHEDIGLILLDLILPGMSGFEFCKQVTHAKATAHIPVIVITGGALRRDEALVKSFDAGAIDFITKPVDEIELYGRTKAALNLFVERVTKSKVTEELARSEERYQLAVDGAADGIWDINLTDMEIHLSRNWKAMLGYGPEDLSTDPDEWKSLLHPEDREKVLNAIDEHLESKTAYYSTEHRLRTKNGNYKWVHSRGKAIWDENGRPVRMAGSTTDISSRKLLESHLRQTQKMESIGRLSSGIAHDFNNLITVIGGYSRLILEQPGAQEKVEHHAGEILNATERASTLTRHLLAFSRKNPDAFQSVDLNETIAGLGSMFQRILGEDIQLKYELTQDVPLIHADTNLLELIVFNLVLNARDAMPEGGELVLRTGQKNVAAQDCATSQEARPGPAVVLSISDTGTGMDEATLNDIFEPFFTTKTAAKGTGLGLFMVYGIVRQHQGWIQVESEPGKGTTFHIHFPPAKVQTRPPPPAVEEAPTRCEGEETVLLVEDEPALRALGNTILSGYGYTVLEASSGPEALRVWAGNKDRIQVLFTDLVMPQGISGQELADMLQAEKDDLRVIYTSGYPFRETPFQRGMIEGVNFIQKPFSPSKLGRIVRQVIEKNPAGQKK